MKKVLITGGGGFIGTHLTKALLEAGLSVAALDIVYQRNDHLLALPNYTQIVGSVIDKELVAKLLSSVDEIVHLAAIASPQAYVVNPKRTIDINLNASIALIEQLRFSGKPIFFASTSEIYGKNPNVPWSENSERVLGPTSINRWCYSTSKAMIEHYLLACHAEKSIEFNGVRIFNCYGPRLRGRVVDKFVVSALQGEKLQVHGDGTQTRCFTYIDDLIQAIAHLIISDRKSNKFYNIGNDVETSMTELAVTICSLLNIDPSTSIEYITHAEAIGPSYEDIPRRVPSFKMAKDDFDWTPTTSLQNGLHQMIEAERAILASLSLNPPISSDTDE
jgi:UDP-glucose 4-epimerase